MSIKTEPWKVVLSWNAIKQLQGVCDRIIEAVECEQTYRAKIYERISKLEGELANLKHIHHKDYGDVTEILDDIESRINQISAKVNTKPSPDPEPDGYWECLTCRNNRVVDKRHAMTYGHAVEWREGTPPKAHADAHLHLDDYLPPSDEDLYKPYPTAGPNEIPIDDLRCPVCGDEMMKDEFDNYECIKDEHSIGVTYANALALQPKRCECDLSKNHRAVFADREYKFCPYCGGAL